MEDHKPKLRCYHLWVFLAATLGGLQSERAIANCVPSDETGTVVERVEDSGELILTDGDHLRLIGVFPVILLPDAKSATAQKLNDLARQALALLQTKTEGKTVRLLPGKRVRDRYDRRLAQAFAPDGTWLQGLLLKQGLARAYSFADNRTCIREMLALEDEARREKRGLWRFRVMKPIAAEDVTRLQQLRYRFQLVEGKIAKAATVGKWSFLNFAADWRSDFTIAIERRDLKDMQKQGFDLDALVGQKVRVRGWIEQWNGPLIKVTHQEQIEVLGKE